MYNNQQQVFCLNILSNHSSYYNGILTDADLIAKRTGEDIRKVLSDPTIMTMMGTWQCVWGPQVKLGPFHDVEKMVINTMFVAYNKLTAQYVVAIAGTDPLSVSNWLLEDFNVDELADWPQAVPSNIITPKISQSTKFGLDVLLNMTAAYADPVSGKAYTDPIGASDFLKKYGAKNVSFAGHSLGGALSPAYALYLYVDWMQAQKAAVHVNPAAGATPGNGAFADYYNSYLGGNTIRLWNTNDIVPHAWDSSLMEQIQYLYTNGPSCPDYLKNRVQELINITEERDYTHLAGGVSFTGRIYQTNPQKSNNDQFMQEAGCQHVCSYPDYFSISNFQNRVQTLLGLKNPYFSAGCS